MMSQNKTKRGLMANLKLRPRLIKTKMKGQKLLENQFARVRYSKARSARAEPALIGDKFPYDPLH